jgi:predicted phosphodiesterase
MKLLILSDIHGNWAALQSVLNTESDSDKILCLGDLVDYGPEPAACVAWAMQECGKSLFIQGNHDWGVALKKDPRSSPPFRHLTACTQAFSLRALSQEMLHFLRDLKPIDSFEMLGKRCVACHAARPVILCSGTCAPPRKISKMKSWSLELRITFFLVIRTGHSRSGSAERPSLTREAWVNPRTATPGLPMPYGRTAKSNCAALPIRWKRLWKPMLALR